MGRRFHGRALVPVLLFVAGCASPGGGQHVTVRASEFKFEPANLTATATQPVRITVRNTGVVVHDWVVQGLDQPVHTKAEPGQDATIEFTPTRAGTFRIVCAEPGHEAAGMTGRLVVQ
jgi:uncharacterized cupredoxin-like copper-binding protein